MSHLYNVFEVYKFVIFIYVFCKIIIQRCSRLQNLSPKWTKLIRRYKSSTPKISMMMKSRIKGAGDPEKM